MKKFTGAPTIPGFYLFNRNGEASICEASRDCVDEQGECDIFMTGLEYWFSPHETKSMEFTGPIDLDAIAAII